MLSLSRAEEDISCKEKKKKIEKRGKNSDQYFSFCHEPSTLSTLFPSRGYWKEFSTTQSEYCPEKNPFTPSKFSPVKSREFYREIKVKSFSLDLPIFCWRSLQMFIKLTRKWLGEFVSKSPRYFFPFQGKIEKSQSKYLLASGKHVLQPSMNVN